MKYLESNFSRPGGKCVGMFPKAWMSKPFPHPPPHLVGGPGVCAEIMVEAAPGPSVPGSGHFQGQFWRSLDAFPEAPDQRGGPLQPLTFPCLPGRAAASAAGSSVPTIQIFPRGPRKALSARVTRFGIGIQDLPSDLLSWGLGMGRLQLQKRP